jgi:hypothetical protein
MHSIFGIATLRMATILKIFRSFGKYWVVAFIFQIKTHDYSLPDSSDAGPPHNIIAWLRVVSACCKIRYNL